MKTKTHMIGFAYESPEIFEPHSVSATVICQCQNILVTTITRLPSGLLESSMAFTCPQCDRDHHKALQGAGNILDVAMKHQRRLASFN